MSFLDPIVTDDGKALFLSQDASELEGSLDELRQWVDEMIGRHGGATRFAIHADESSYATYSLERAATAEELATRAAAIAKVKADAEEREKAQLAALKAKWEKG